jgi:hypothetical protein
MVMLIINMFLVSMSFESLFISRDLDTRMISFTTYHFGTYALLNDRHAHMPFQSWRMRPKSVNHLLFTLNTQSFEINFEVRVSLIFKQKMKLQTK